MNSDAPHPASLHPEALAAQCESRFTRRSGPGGQNRNKVETAVILRHKPTGLLAEASERRTQGENLRAALFRLRLLLALEIRRPFETPSELWRTRCAGGRLRVNPEHDDFPALLAEALDAAHGRAFDLKAAASDLGTTASQLLRFFKDEPRAVLQVNAARQASGLHPLK